MTTQEKIIEDFLIKNNFKYSPQYSFNDCKFKKKLKFDFAVFNDNDSLKCLIEYDGIRHYKCIDGNYDSFNQALWKDKIKNEYCEENYIPLLRIPYKITKEKDIERILVHHLINDNPILLDDLYLDDDENEDIDESLNDRKDLFEEYHIDYITELYLNGKLEDFLDEYYNKEDEDSNEEE